MNEETRREASIPVQSRIDIRTLAEICYYFEQENIEIRTASQLVSWALEMLVGTLRSNDRLPHDRPLIEAAYIFLGDRDLMQKRMKGKKLNLAMGFEQLKLGGDSPAQYAPAEHKAIHNNPNWTGEGDIKIPAENTPEYTEARKKAREMLSKGREEEARKKLKEEMERLKDTGMIDEKGVITPNIDSIKSNPTEEDMERSKAEQIVRDKKHAEEKERDKELRKKERRKETLVRGIEKLQEEIEEIEGEEVGDDAPRVRSHEEILVHRAERDAKDEEDRKLLDEADAMLLNSTKEEGNG